MFLNKDKLIIGLNELDIMELKIKLSQLEAKLSNTRDIEIWKKY